MITDHSAEEEEEGMDDHGVDCGDGCDDDNDHNGDANGKWWKVGRYGSHARFADGN